MQDGDADEGEERDEFHGGTLPPGDIERVPGRQLGQDSTKDLNRYGTTFWPYSGVPEKAPNPQNQLSRCPKKRIKIPETGLLLTQAVKSEGTNGFSAIELPHVMPVGASQHHKTMPEDAHLPRPSHSSMLSVRPMTCLSVKLPQSLSQPRPRIL